MHSPLYAYIAFYICNTDMDLDISGRRAASFNKIFWENGSLFFNFLYLTDLKGWGGEHYMNCVTYLSLTTQLYMLQFLCNQWALLKKFYITCQKFMVCSFNS